jgi:protoporphyrinogen oxidase
VDAVPVRDYLVRLGGEAVFDTVWRPLLRCKLGAAWREASAAFIWSSINRLYAARATPDRAEKMGFLRGSYEVMLVRMLDRIRASGGEVRAGASVDRLEPEAGRLAVVTEGRRTIHDQVISTIPPGRLAPIVEALAPDYAAELRGHRFHGVRVLLLLLRRPLTGYYVLNLADPDMPVTGVIEMGSLAPEDYFGPGRSLVYLPRYAPAGAPEYEQDDHAFRRDCLGLLRRIQPAFSEDWIEAEAAFRAPQVFALPEVGYGRRVPPVRTPIRGLFFAHNLQIYPRTLHNDAVVEVARQVDVELATPRPAGP